MKEEATIFAMATAPGRAGVAVLRISGPRAKEAIEKIAGDAPLPRRATHTVFRNPKDGEVLDKGLLLWFPAPASYTGEDVAEFHIHGGRATVAGLCGTLSELPGLRLAEPGEFTRRAFENGKLDLTEAEAIADLVDAETLAQKRQALRQLDGELGRRCEDWRQRLMRALALCEAAIDFPEEGLPDDLMAKTEAVCFEVAGEIDALLSDGRKGQRVRDGLMIAILGPPNAGKSSLLNLLAQRDAAITAATAGTTRDVIEVHLDLGGYPVTLADTAGLRSTADPVEEEGVRRAHLVAARADFKLLMLDGADPSGFTVVETLADDDALIVVNKMDLVSGPGVFEKQFKKHGYLPLSLRTGSGVPELLDRVQCEVESRLSGGGGVITRERHREALGACRAALRNMRPSELPELTAEELRQAIRSLGRITGKVDVESMLDLLFKEFCIGK